MALLVRIYYNAVFGALGGLLGWMLFGVFGSKNPSTEGVPFLFGLLSWEDANMILGGAVIGGVIGWLASILMKTNAQMGILANVLVGIIGSILGVALARELGVRAHTAPGAWIVAVLGAALLIAILRSLGVFRGVRSARARYR